MHIKFWSENLREETTWKTRHRWEDNIRMDLREVWWEDVDWIHLAHYRDQWQAGSSEHRNESSGSIKVFLTSCLSYSQEGSCSMELIS